MNFKKNALKVAIGAATVAAAQSSMAGTWATAADPIFATEVFGTGSAATELTIGNAVYTLGPVSGSEIVVANGASQIVYTLTGATWGDTPPAISFNDVTTNGGAVSFNLVDGGANTDSTATFRVTTTNPLFNTDQISLSYNIKGVSSLAAATTTGGPTLAFSFTDTVGNVDTTGTAQVIAGSIAGTTLTATASAAGAQKIDVANASTQLTAGTTLSFDAGSFLITDATGAANGVESDGATEWNAGQTDAAGTGLVTVTGDFSASIVDTDSDGNSAQGEGVTITGCLTKNATTLTADTASFALTTGEITAAQGTACDVSIVFDGTTIIPEFSTGLTVAIDYTGTTVVDESLSASLASLGRDGDSQPADLLLNPDGAYDNFVRISNKSSVSGTVLATLYNDAGDSVSFTVVDTLAAQASTDLISVATLYESAQAADATFDVGTGKLRATITGEFGSIGVQNISTSTDGTTFFTF